MLFEKNLKDKMLDGKIIFYYFAVQHFVF